MRLPLLAQLLVQFGHELRLRVKVGLQTRKGVQCFASGITLGGRVLPQLRDGDPFVVQLGAKP